MKLRFYIDLWPGLDPARYAVFASTQPCAKSEGCKRMAFDVAIPDSLLFGLDAVAPEVSRPELVVDHDDLPGMWDRSDLVGGETDMPANAALTGAEGVRVEGTVIRGDGK